MANPLLFFNLLVVFGTKLVGGSLLMLSILLSLLESLEEKAVLPLTGVKNSSMRRMERMGDDEVTEGGVMDTSEISDTFELTRIAVVGVDLIGAVIWIDFFFFCLGDDETGTGTGAESQKP